MELIADVLLIASAIGAGLYCLVLSRRLTRFTDLENGVGGAVAVLSVQVDELKSALEDARAASRAASDSLAETTERADATARRLEMLIASTHGDEIPDAKPEASTARAVRRRRRGTAKNGERESAA